MAIDNQGFAEEFDKFYVNTGNTLSDKIPTGYVCPRSVITKSDNKSMSVASVMEDAVWKFTKD